MPTSLEARSVSMTFPVKTGLLRRPALLRAVDSVSFCLDQGMSVGLVGESGCGKSTLGRLACGLLRPTSGSFHLDGMEIGCGATRSGTKGTIQMIFQDPVSSLDPRITVLDSVAEPLRARGVGARKARAEAETMLEMIGLPGMGRRYPHQFSGGQRQRIAIGRALAARPEFIVCDEPVSALDASVQAQILNLLRDLQESFRPAYLFISHNLAVTGFMCPRIMVMYLGQIVEKAPREDLFAHAGHPYSRALLAAMPKGDWQNGSEPLPPPLSGELPSPISPPPGCYFHPRCPVARPICAKERPPWKKLGLDWEARCHFAEETAKGNYSQESACPAPRG